ncbi:hypothetical protein EYZ11_009905 [Aspergillus tanneri]|uniref:AB hydrolase-1 domain-containing protein n=1 Tax=Aspergillus tanneri TaxID=1220188 RepID=A0A4S3J6N6_9EURO|nr:uncharacterized protein ATNIH1004_000780 [Aspergillus tanneri]KAA8651882.1 hypothetical protein ATNIH1004_000780 [Aspergillus tanneri]THC90626.1 hypothetical protein EYZ11_009905 [Aspergillus tanneri]
MLLTHFFPRNETFSYEALRAAGYSNYAGADLSEVIVICSRIRAGNEGDWVREWQTAADRAVRNAQECVTEGNTVSAHEAYLRASNYYRTAEFFRRQDPFNDEISRTLSERSVDAFIKAMQYSSSSTCEAITIPYEDTTLPGYFMQPLTQEEQRPRKTLVFNGGFDSTKEEAWFAIAAAALARGYNVLAFDGPGQGTALRSQRLFFRADWENVLTPVMDYVYSRREVDINAVVIFGWSMGGYLVARAATSEHRARALILNDGVYDFGAVFTKDQPWILQKLLDMGYDSAVNMLVRAATNATTGMRWGILNGKWTLGAESEADLMRKVTEYTLEGRIEKITTPCLVLEAQNDHFFKGQPQMVRDRLRCEMEYVSLGPEEGADSHCHQGAFGRLNQVMFNYLEQRLHTE